ncbi:MAG: hypothetical protein ACYSRP_00540 [Planctomycetota bacterium]|jgi:hypothetical protein
MNKTVTGAFARPWMWGAVGGFVLAALIVVTSLTGLAEGNVLEGVRNFLSALPVLLVMRLWPAAPDFFAAAVLFVYWVGLGALVGRGIVRGKAGLIGVAIGIVVLALAHFQAKLNMELQLEGAAKAFGSFVQELERSLRGGGTGK